MKILTVDFETYYDQAFSLSKVTTEEYIRDPRFETIGVAVQDGDKQPVWFSGSHEDLYQFLKSFDWENSVALAHNAVFDGAILSWIYGISPRGWVDTLSMARALHGTEVGGSLKVLTRHYGLGEKGTEVENALGLRRQDFSEQQLGRYGEYCKNDVAITYELFKAMATDFPPTELRLIDLTIRMFTEPLLQLDTVLLESYLRQVRQKKEEILGKFDKDTLMSNPQFADLLRSLGVEPPMKVSPTTGKSTYAFSKTDEGFKLLLEHENTHVQAAVAARLGTKSTIEETRTERFIGIAGRGALPVPLRYYAAHTGRWGGDDKLNLQNIPRASPLKHAIVAPDGYMMIDSDSSQIEARTLAWLAGQNDLVQAFEDGEDVYKIMASAIYGKPQSEITKEERFVGKTTILGCFGADTKVLTNSGWKCIVEVLATDKVWDGESWVTHRGVIPKGQRETIRAWGVDATPEHEILTEHGWREWHEVVTNPILSQSAFAKAHSLLLTGSNISSPWVNPQGGILLSDATADGKVKLIATTLKRDAQLGVTRALKARLMPHVKSIGGMNLLSPIWDKGKDCLIALQASLQDAIQKRVKHTRTMVDVVSRYMNLGATPVLTSYSTLPLCLIGTIQVETLTALTTTKGMSQTTYGLQPEVRTQKTNEPLEQCKRSLMTYDIAYAGPNNRFVIATDAGPLIVHNCGYGMGAAKFKMQLKTFGVDIELEEAKRIIDAYRRTYPMIPELWRSAHNTLEAIIGNQYIEFGRDGILKVEGQNGILLPNNLYVKYPNLRLVEAERDGTFKAEYVYDAKRGKQTISNRIYGGKIIENVCQALARIVIGEQMLRVAKKYRVVMTVHDAIGCVVPEADVAVAKEYVELCMRLRPSWAPKLPLNCEAGYGKTYGEC